MWADKRYHSLDYEMKARYGHKIYKIALDGGFTCPNRDGLIDTRGCIFCSAGGSGDFAASRNQSIIEQIGRRQTAACRETGLTPLRFPAILPIFRHLRELMPHRSSSGILHRSHPPPGSSHSFHCHPPGLSSTGGSRSFIRTESDQTGVS